MNQPAMASDHLPTNVAVPIGLMMLQMPLLDASPCTLYTYDLAIMNLNPADITSSDENNPAICRACVYWSLFRHVSLSS
jgi:hypothetical protein